MKEYGMAPKFVATTQQVPIAPSFSTPWKVGSGSRCCDAARKEDPHMSPFSGASRPVSLLSVERKTLHHQAYVQGGKDLYDKESRVLAVLPDFLVLSRQHWIQNARTLHALNVNSSPYMQPDSPASQ
ncbi:uncharacterized protein ARMOST_21094 [Armillaria ostoyae]|uniref:Uncharacterized protein n=1 Tax=Armillaria ostoyae TaxID=47428 RepID=A0A284S953_ARMOS|nr:uncharacterized protein ARMOST_21094 [Armillaria ostoyae]